MTENFEVSQSWDTSVCNHNACQVQFTIRRLFQLEVSNFYTL